MEIFKVEMNFFGASENGSQTSTSYLELAPRSSSKYFLHTSVMFFIFSVQCPCR